MGILKLHAGAGFRITIFDERTRGDSSKPRLERVVVAGEEGEEANVQVEVQAYTDADIKTFRV